MQTSRTLKCTKAEINDLYNRILPSAIKQTQPQYTYWQLKVKDCTITAYTSGKVLFQGKDLSWADLPAGQGEPQQKTNPEKKPKADLSRQFPMAGSDEVGVGDYFGPVVVAGCIVETEEIARKLEAMKITDSKAMDDAAIRQAAPEIMKLCPYSVCILENTRYNEIYARLKNLNTIKSRLHNQVYLNLKAKGHSLPDLCIIDQFCPESAYYRHLEGSGEIIENIHFETRAESKYIAVAAASVIARSIFLKMMDQMNNKYEFSFALGGGSRADSSGLQFLEEHPLSDLEHVAKLHFANTEKILSRWNRKHPNEHYRNPWK